MLSAVIKWVKISPFPLIFVSRRSKISSCRMLAISGLLKYPIPGPYSASAPCHRYSAGRLNQGSRVLPPPGEREMLRGSTLVPDRHWQVSNKTVCRVWMMKWDDFFQIKSAQFSILHPHCTSCMQSQVSAGTTFSSYTKRIFNTHRYVRVLNQIYIRSFIFIN